MSNFSGWPFSQLFRLSVTRSAHFRVTSRSVLRASVICPPASRGFRWSRFGTCSGTDCHGARPPAKPSRLCRQRRGILQLQDFRNELSRAGTDR